MTPPSAELNHFVPFFDVVDTLGTRLSPDILLGNPYLLYFYPKDHTPGCTDQACQFRDEFKHFESLHTKVIGISPDDKKSHERFAHKFQLPFSLVSDPQHELCTLFKVWEQKKLYGKTYMGVVRTTFLVDSRGVIRWIEKPVNVKNQSQRALEAIQHL